MRNFRSTEFQWNGLFPFGGFKPPTGRIHQWEEMERGREAKADNQFLDCGQYSFGRYSILIVHRHASQIHNLLIYEYVGCVMPVKQLVINLFREGRRRRRKMYGSPLANKL